jgi:hypothetical protein
MEGSSQLQATAVLSLGKGPQNQVNRNIGIYIPSDGLEAVEKRKSFAIPRN